MSWCADFGFRGTCRIPDSPEPVPAHQLFQYVDYPAVSLGADPGLSDYMVVFQGNDGIGRRGVYRAFGGELKTVHTPAHTPAPTQGLPRRSKAFVTHSAQTQDTSPGVLYELVC